MLNVGPSLHIEVSTGKTLFSREERHSDSVLEVPVLPESEKKKIKFHGSCFAIGKLRQNITLYEYNYRLRPVIGIPLIHTTPEQLQQATGCLYCETYVTVSR
jgi:hypothetical protein